MRFILTTLIVLFSASASFAAGCDKYTQPRYVTAIKTVATHLGYSFEEMCNLPKIWDVEAQPSRVITREGEVIPHVAVQLHMEYHSCLYMVRDADQAVTDGRCYSGF